MRYSVALATLLGKKLRVVNIRKKRAKPGLRRQHLTAIQACARISGGNVEGAEVGSNEIIYKPGSHVIPGNYHFDIGSAGSTTLLGFTLSIPTLFAAETCHFTLVGGLFQDYAPTAFHMKYCLLPMLSRLGAVMDLQIVRPGYVPKGEGILKITVQPANHRLVPFVGLDQGGINTIKLKALSSHLSEANVGPRMVNACEQILKKEGFDTQVGILEDAISAQKGAALLAWTISKTGAILGADMAGSRGRSSERIGRSVAYALLSDIHTNAFVDTHLADQLIIYAALAQGTTSYRVPTITEHIESNLWLVEEILGAKTQIKGLELTIKGIGFG